MNHYEFYNKILGMDSKIIKIDESFYLTMDLHSKRFKNYITECKSNQICLQMAMSLYHPKLDLFEEDFDLTYAMIIQQIIKEKKMGYFVVISFPREKNCGAIVYGETLQDVFDKIEDYYISQISGEWVKTKDLTYQQRKELDFMLNRKIQ